MGSPALWGDQGPWACGTEEAGAGQWRGEVGQVILERLSAFPRADYIRCCKFCYPLCAFVILAACVVACVGLVWMQVALKEDLDVIKEKFRTSKYVWLCCCLFALGSMESSVCPPARSAPVGTELTHCRDWRSPLNPR